MKINHTIRTLIIGDFMTNAGFSVFAPIFALFFTGQIEGGTLANVGFAAAITQIFKSVLQIPIAKFLDKNHGEYDDFYSLIFGSFIVASVPFLYIFASKVSHIYLIQAIYGIGMSFVIPPWYAIFSRHLDKQQESTEWSLDSVTIGIAVSSAAALGGVLATRFGFTRVFLIGGILAIMGAIQQIRIYRDLRGKVPRGQVNPLPDKTS